MAKFRITKNVKGYYFPQRKTWYGWCYIDNFGSLHTGPECMGRKTEEQAIADCERYAQGVWIEQEEVVKEFKL